MYKWHILGSSTGQKEKGIEMAHAKLTDPIHIIGVGTLGMRIARSLDELGLERISSTLNLWDGDNVESQNVRAQLFRAEHVSFPKVEAAKGILNTWSNLPIVAHNTYVDSKHHISGIAFVCVHTMAARWRIWETCLKGNDDVLMIELRVGQDTATIRVLDPSEKAHQDAWEHYWYPDPPGAEVSCGVTVSLGPIANIVAEIAVWQAVRFTEIVNGSNDRLVNQIQIGMRPPRLESHIW